MLKSQITDKHNCLALVGDKDVVITKQIMGLNKDVWFLGISTRRIHIKFCPFCGKELD